MKRNTNLSNLLLKKYLDGECTAAEKELVERWYDELHGPQEELDAPLLTNNLNSIQEKLSVNTKLKAIKWYKHPLSVAAAVAVLLSIAIGIRYLKQAPVPQISIVSSDKEKAYILTSTGDSLNLTGMAIGEKANLGALLIERNKDGEVCYRSLESLIPQQVRIITPPAGHYRFILPDGTKVHLNAGSSLLFNSDLASGNRMVRLNGEAYFEVIPQLNQQGGKNPFTVHSKGQKITVLGTQFNICAYDNDSFSNTILLEGAIDLEAMFGKKTSVRLKPGQKVTLDNKTGALLTDAVEKETSIDWTSGYYKFENETLEILAKRLSRWYDVEIITDPSVAQLTFGGRISRQEDLLKAIEILEMTGKIKVLQEENQQKKKLTITNTN
ncbi:FecR family protein [Sphingobacterium tabacisoli]|uniref:FecR family protein n=1 Tax=Sphingobacterium tabacisoli TaxID=2044855 RepID=A0ABW5L8V1_9SPHI|nr:FecR domain-containing protein [Sphingobacterium tabacisoli]